MASTYSQELNLPILQGLRLTRTKRQVIQNLIHESNFFNYCNDPDILEELLFGLHNKVHRHDGTARGVLQDSEDEQVLKSEKNTRKKRDKHEKVPKTTAKTKSDSGQVQLYAFQYRKFVPAPQVDDLKDVPVIQQQQEEDDDEDLEYSANVGHKNTSDSSGYEYESDDEITKINKQKGRLKKQFKKSRRLEMIFLATDNRLYKLVLTKLHFWVLPRFGNMETLEFATEPCLRKLYELEIIRKTKLYNLAPIRPEQTIEYERHHPGLFDTYNHEDILAPYEVRFLDCQLVELPYISPDLLRIPLHQRIDLDYKFLVYNDVELREVFRVEPYELLTFMKVYEHVDFENQMDNINKTFKAGVTRDQNYRLEYTNKNLVSWKVNSWHDQDHAEDSFGSAVEASADEHETDEKEDVATFPSRRHPPRDAVTVLSSSSSALASSSSPSRSSGSRKSKSSKPKIFEAIQEQKTKTTEKICQLLYTQYKGTPVVKIKDRKYKDERYRVLLACPDKPVKFVFMQYRVDRSHDSVMFCLTVQDFATLKDLWSELSDTSRCLLFKHILI
jgi:hypothetical protein